MKDKDKTKEQLINEMAELRERVTELEFLAGDRKKFENDLFYERGLTDELFNNIPDYVYFKDKDRRFVHVSKYFGDIFGVDPEDIIGKTDEDLFPEDIAKETVNDDRHIIETGLPIINKEEGGESIAGGEHWVLTTKLPWRDKDGNIIGLFGISREITKHKLAERELRESEEKYRGLVERVNDGVVIVQDGVVKFVNKQMAEMFGYSVEEMFDTSFINYVYPDELTKALDIYNRYHQGEDVPAFYEMGALHRDGGRFDIEVNFGVTTYDGKPATFSFIRDITDRKTTEKLLRESEGRYRLIIENQSDLIVKVDLEGIIEFVTPAYCKYFGKTEEELLGHQSMNRVHEEDREKTARALKDIYKPPYKCYIEQRVMTEHGWRWCGWAAKAVLDTNNNVSSFVSVGRDITERKKAEMALEESEERFRTIVETAPSLLIISDPEGITLYASPNCKDFLGYAQDELQGQSKWWIHEDDTPRVKKIFDRALRDGTAIKNLEYRAVKKNGELWYASTSWEPFRGREGKYIGHMRQILDITERKYLEEQLQLRQRMDSLGTLAGGIAHDFNNLLVGIMGYIDMINLDPGNLTEAQKECIDNALRSSQRAADLVRQVQTLSRGDVSKKSSADIYETVGEVFGMLEKTTDRLIKKEVLFETGKYHVAANISELHQVFLNLGTNAIQSIEERGVKPGDYIRVSAEDYVIRGIEITGLSEGEYVHIIFEDNGCGMTEEVKKKAFDPLFTTKDVGGRRGQGLGLAMVYNIITQRHGGYIDIVSKLKKGTTFHIYLPKSVPEEKRYSEEEGIKGGDETVLIIEDEEQVRGLAESLLKNYGYKVLTAVDGEEGLKLYIKNKGIIDLVLLDLTMPRMSGKMVFEKILSINPESRVIICSGQSDEAIRDGVLSSARGFLKKPYRVKDLANTVREVLPRR
jgi:PAS domain S-box-containing protein